MAEVYLAERADELYDQTVAVKVVSWGLEEDGLRRFEQERQIVASLSHPNITRLLDGGLTADGRPFLVLEYVDGRPIDEFCDAHRLTLVERLRLFTLVARAVHHAHKNLLVHRDLKPSNILVTAEGDPKLLDFGIAKLLEDDATRMRDRTGTTSLWLTPSWASPELLAAEPVTTVSDIYQLGLLLYVLLTGRRAFNFQGRSPQEVERIVGAGLLALPSEAVASLSDAQALDVTEARRTSRHRLERALRGDLDVIVGMALRVEPERRYASAEQMAEDLERHLDGMPVLARGDTVGYRVRKFVRRHQWAAVATLAFAILLAGYVVTLTVQSRSVARERDRAQAEAVKTEQVKEFLIHLLQSADPAATAGAEVTVRSLLDRSVLEIESLSDQPDVEIEMRHVIGRTYCFLGAFHAGKPQLELALELAIRHYDDDQAQVAEILNDLAFAEERMGDTTRAEELHRRALGIRLTLFGERSGKVSGSMHNLARALHARGAFDEAESLFRRSLVIDRELAGTDLHADVGYDLSSLGHLLADRGHFEEARELLERSLAIRRHLWGDLHPGIGRSWKYIAQLELAEGDLGAAEEAIENALAIHGRVLGDTHIEMSFGRVVHGQILAARGDLDEARGVLEDALDWLRGSVRSDHRVTVAALSALADVLRRAGELEEALSRLREAETAVGDRLDENLMGAELLYVKGLVLVDLGRTSEAERHLEAAFLASRRLYGLDDYRTRRAAETRAGLQGPPPGLRPAA